MHSRTNEGVHKPGKIKSNDDINFSETVWSYATWLKLYLYDTVASPERKNSPAAAVLQLRA